MGPKLLPELKSSTHTATITTEEQLTHAVGVSRSWPFTKRRTACRPPQTDALYRFQPAPPNLRREVSDATDRPGSAALLTSSMESPTNSNAGHRDDGAAGFVPTHCLHANGTIGRRFLVDIAIRTEAAKTRPGRFRPKLGRLKRGWQSSAGCQCAAPRKLASPTSPDPNGTGLHRRQGGQFHFRRAPPGPDETRPLG